MFRIENKALGILLGFLSSAAIASFRCIDDGSNPRLLLSGKNLYGSVSQIVFSQEDPQTGTTYFKLYCHSVQD